MKKIGYARVSTEDQKLDLQIAALKAASCEQIFTDHGVSGRAFERPGLDAALNSLQEGDTLVVWRLDRLGRSLVELVRLIESFASRGIHFCSITESMDTTSSGGRLLFHVIAALAEFERALISERTRAGMAAARDSGQRLGRPPAMSHDQLKEAATAIRVGGESVHQVAERYNVTPRSLRRMLKNAELVTQVTQ